MRRHNFLASLVPTALLTVLGFAVMGYHPGAEDDGVYLSAVKANLNPALYPHDADFFRIQLQATQFDGWMAAWIRATGIPVGWAEMVGQIASLFLILWACGSIARQLFAGRRAQWTGVALVVAMFPLPVAGTALCLADQYLHPRAPATALILIAVSRILAGKRWQAIPLLALAALLHPIMAAFGISFCCILTLTARTTMPVKRQRAAALAPVAAAMPLGWIFEPPSASWRKALDWKDYLHLSRWTWYEWLGALAPILLFWLLWRYARRRGEAKLAWFARAVLVYGVFQLTVAMIVQSNPETVRLMPLQPMRFLHLIYIFLALIGGCLLGELLCKGSVWRGAALLAAVFLGMFAGQRALFGGSEHLELPGRHTDNRWLQAFAWIRENTPTGAYFALGAEYMAAPGEDFHSFRALAERSQLADRYKDTAMVTQVPALGPAWQRQVEAQQGWARFQLADFERLKAEFGVDWALVSYPQPAGLECKWHNDALSVCRIP